MRNYSIIDRLIQDFDAGLKTLTSSAVAKRTVDTTDVDAPELSENDRKVSAGCMRVNHSGEICAQALYRGQQWFVRDEATQAMLRQAEVEETDHLAWCEQRLTELQSKKSVLDPFWYSHSFLIGALAAWCGDAWSLGFVEETERQVGEHLETHLAKLPADDHKSRAIVKQMHIDETQHGQSAADAGAKPLPPPVKQAMKLVAKVMTTTSYYI